MSHTHDAIRVSEALSGESTQLVGADASDDAPGPKMAPQATRTDPPAALDPQANAEHFTMERHEGSRLPSGGGGGGGGEGGGDMKPVTLRTAPTDARFPTTNQSRRCYVAYNEYFKCINEKGKGHGDCKPYMRAFRSICPDEWIERWQELRDTGAWYGKY